MINKLNTNLFFILSSNCKAVKGAKRSLITDYTRKEFFFIENDFYDLLIEINRKKIVDGLQLIDSESEEPFFEFIDFLLSNEIGFLVEDVNSFPQISDSFDSPTIIKDVILKINESTFNKTRYVKIITELDSLACNDAMLQVISKSSFEFINNLLLITNDSSINHIELHIQYDDSFEIEELKSLIFKYSPLSNIYIYNSPKKELIDFTIKKEPFYPMNFGQIHLLNYDFRNGEICGVISQETLSLESLKSHNEFKATNSCLFKKVTINEYGIIKNCPSLKQSYGSIDDISIKEVIETKDFQQFWHINKAQIDICKVCEFRYNCSDCRAFIRDKNNVYSKPSKCTYNPYTTTWEK